MKLLYYLPALGPPHLEKKLGALARNLSMIREQAGAPVDVVLNSYGGDLGAQEATARKAGGGEVRTHRARGVLAELFLRCPHNEVARDYERVLFVFDDIALTRLDLQALASASELGVDIVSPIIRGATHAYMQPSTLPRLTRAPCLEAYFYCMTPVTFERYLALNDTANKWMWGVDLILEREGLTCALSGSSEAEHLFSSKTDSVHCAEATGLMGGYLRKRGYAFDPDGRLVRISSSHRVGTDAVDEWAEACPAHPVRDSTDIRVRDHGRPGAAYWRSNRNPELPAATRMHRLSEDSAARSRGTGGPPLHAAELYSIQESGVQWWRGQTG